MAGPTIFAIIYSSVTIWAALYSQVLLQRSMDFYQWMAVLAVFGGLALMVARTKKGTIASVIFGVAIATALMPPLCTAGYGLAIWNIKYFVGAMYLFTINAIFIALATFIVLKLLNSSLPIWTP